MSMTNAERCRQWRKDNPGKNAAAVKKWRKANPEKFQRCQKRHYQASLARFRVWYAVKKGILIKQPCWCGSKKVEAHHANGYKNALDVVWLCRPHHLEIHNQ